MCSETNALSITRNSQPQLSGPPDICTAGGQRTIAMSWSLPAWGLDEPWNEKEIAPKDVSRWRFSLRFKIKGRMQKWSTLWCRMSMNVRHSCVPSCKSAIQRPFPRRFPPDFTHSPHGIPWHHCAPQGEELLSEAPDLPRGASRKSSVAPMEGLHRSIWSLPEESMGH